MLSLFFFFNDTATTEIYTLSLHDALPIYISGKIADLRELGFADPVKMITVSPTLLELAKPSSRSEEHTSELQSPDHLVCRLLLEKKKKQIIQTQHGP